MNELVFIPLGGVGEIGMNLALYGYGPEGKREYIIVDCGVTFPGPDLPGVDLVLPDISYIKARKDQLKAIIITHAHEDHYGALLTLYPELSPKFDVPLFMTPFASGMLESKTRGEPHAPRLLVNEFNAGDIFEAGPFEVEAISVTHSIPEPVSLAIRSPLGIVVHTGDWKNDPAPSLGGLTDEARFRALGDEGVLALVCDSTNAMRDGTSPSEQEVSSGLRKVIESAQGRVAVTTFSSNVGRIRSIAEAARDAGRQCLLIGRSMKRVVEVASDLNYMDDLPPFLDESEFAHIPRKNAVIILTGSQGEKRAALAKLSRGEMRDISLNAGDTVVYSSRDIPGNEKSILEVKNKLIDMGVHIVEDGSELVHVSGHPRRDELKHMYSWTRPQIGVPVHGEPAHLNAHAALMRESGIEVVLDARNGDIVRLAPEMGEILGAVPYGQIYKDGDVIGTDNEIGVVDRRRLSFAGHVAFSIIFDRDTNIIGEPQLCSIGLPIEDSTGNNIDDILFDAAIGAVDSVPKSRRKDLDLVEDATARAIRAAARKTWGKKPVVTVFVDRV